MNNTWVKYTGVFLLGILIGLAGGAWGVRRHFQKALAPRDPGQRILQRLDRELGLDPVQHQKVEALLKEGRDKMEALRGEVEPKFEALKKEGEDSIRALLNPEQMKKYDEMKTRWEKTHGDRAGGHGGFMRGRGGPRPPAPPPKPPKK